MTIDEWERGLRIVGDEAYLPGEPLSFPMPKPWREMTDAERRGYKRDWMRLKRQLDPDFRARERQRQRQQRKGARFKRLTDVELSAEIRVAERRLQALWTERTRRERRQEREQPGERQSA